MRMPEKTRFFIPAPVLGRIAVFLCVFYMILGLCHTDVVPMNEFLCHHGTEQLQTIDFSQNLDIELSLRVKVAERGW